MRRGAKGASGAINANTGEFTLYTVKPGDGAFPGKYKVTVMLDGSYPPKPNGASSLVPTEYTSPDTTPLGGGDQLEQPALRIRGAQESPGR